MWTIKLLSLQLVLFSFILTFAQEQYSVNLNYLENLNDELCQIEPYQDDFIVLSRNNACEFDLSGQSLCTLVSRIDAEGNIIWREFINPTNDGDTHISDTEDLIIKNDSIISIHSITNSEVEKQFLIDIRSSSGALIDNKVFSFDGDLSSPSGIIELNNHFYIYLFPNFASVEIWKFTLDFELLDRFVVEISNGLSNGLDLSPLDNDKLILSYSDFGPFSYSYYNLKIYNEDFELLDEYRGLETAEHLSKVVTLPTADNGFMIGWNKDLAYSLYDTFPYPSAIYKLDSLLNLEWEYVFVHRGAKQFNHLRSVGNGEFLGIGASDFLYTTDYDPSPMWTYNGWVFLIDEEGKLIWERDIYDTRYDRYNFLADGVRTPFGFALVGVLDTVKTIASPFLNDPDSWYLTLDEAGCWNGNCNDYILIDSDSTSFTIQGVTAIETAENNVELKIYPNPANEILSFEFNSNQQRVLSLFNMGGIKIMEQKLYAKKSTINLSGISNGLYLINISDLNGLIIKREKVVIKK